MRPNQTDFCGEELSFQTRLDNRQLIRLEAKSNLNRQRVSENFFAVLKLRLSPIAFGNQTISREKRSETIFSKETHGFASPPRDRFAFIVCNRLRKIICRFTENSSRSNSQNYLNLYPFVCQHQTFLYEPCLFRQPVFLPIIFSGRHAEIEENLDIINFVP